MRHSSSAVSRCELRMDLIEPDMDSHNGVIFLGLPTEVVHKVGGLTNSAQRVDGVGDISSGLLCRRSC